MGNPKRCHTTHSKKQRSGLNFWKTFAVAVTKIFLPAALRDCLSAAGPPTQLRFRNAASASLAVLQDCHSLRRVIALQQDNYPGSRMITPYLHDAAKNVYRIQHTAEWDLKVGDQSTPSNLVHADGKTLVKTHWPNIGSHLNKRETNRAIGLRSFADSANFSTSQRRVVR
jgi:hypothetical protein